MSERPTTHRGPATGGDIKPLAVSVGTAEIAEARQALREWAIRARLPAALVNDLVLAAYEAMANVSEHAYFGKVGPVNLGASLVQDGRVDVVVSDRGRWAPPSTDPEPRQFGLPLIDRLADAVDIERAETGTTVRMTWRLGREH